MNAEADVEHAAESLLSADELRLLQQRSDAKGLVRFGLHLAAVLGSGALYGASLARSGHPLLTALLAVTLGFTLVTMFAAMHESVHRTAFKSRSLNDAAGWLAGLLSFYNSTFYRYYHGWHHRFTQIPGRDPELEDEKPTGFSSYFLELSAAPWWLGKLRTYFKIASGNVEGYGFLNEQTRPAVVRSVRLQLAVYGLAIAASFGLGEALFVTYWLLPVAAAQPLLRAILLAEHTGCAESDDALVNTRTTYTIFPIRFLMWEMPYHAEHHRYPALPFFALRAAHRRLKPKLAHLATGGYSSVHRGLLKAFAQSPQTGSASRTEEN